MPPNPQNLNPPWPKGVSGNTGGRPKKHSMQTELGKMLDAKPEVLRALISKGIQEALKGDFRYWKELYDRLDGKVAASVEIDTKRTLQDVIQELDTDAIGKEDSPSGS